MHTRRGLSPGERGGQTDGTRSQLAISTLCLAEFIDVLSVTVVVTALPAVLRSLDAGTALGGLMVTAYAACFGGCLILAGRLSDVYGHRRTMVLGLLGFAITSLAAAIAPSGWWLVAARGLQGLAAAMTVPAAMTLLLAVAEAPRLRARALGIWTAAGAVAGASGFVLGGLVTDLIGWRWVFLINAPLALGLVAAVRRWVRVSPPRRSNRRLDLRGAALLTGGLMTLVLGASLLERAGRVPVALALVATGITLTIAFVAWERRVTAPLMPPGIWRQRHLVTGCAISFANNAATSSAMVLAALHVQDVAGLRPTTAGLALLPFSLTVVVGSALAPPLLRTRARPTVMALGLVVVAAGTLVLLATGGPASVAVVVAGVALAGGGLGLSAVAATNHGTDVERGDRALASAAITTAAQLGTALGVAAVVTLAAAVTAGATPVSGHHAGWAAAGAIALCGAAVAVRSHRRVPVGSRGTVPSC